MGEFCRTDVELFAEPIARLLLPRIDNRWVHPVTTDVFLCFRNLYSTLSQTQDCRYFCDVLLHMSLEKYEPRQNSAERLSDLKVHDLR